MIISDVNLAGMSGIDFLKAVREIDLNVPIVLMTDSPTVETATQAVEYGVCRYVSKSVGMDVLEDTLRRAERWHTLRGTRAEPNGQSQAAAPVPDSLPKVASP